MWRKRAGNLPTMSSVWRNYCLAIFLWLEHKFCSFFYLMEQMLDIMNDSKQVLYAQCTAKWPGGLQCSVPVFDVIHERPLCDEHARKKVWNQKDCWSNCSFPIPFFHLLDLTLVVKCMVSVLMFVCVWLCKFTSCRVFKPLLQK